MGELWEKWPLDQTINGISEQTQLLALNTPSDHTRQQLQIPEPLRQVALPIAKPQPTAMALQEQTPTAF